MSTFDSHTAGGGTPDDDRTAQLLVQALAAEAGEVDPGPEGLVAIQRRTGHGARGRSRAHWIFGAAGAGLATAAVVTTIVVLSQVGSSGDGSPVHQADGPVARPIHTAGYDPTAPAADQLTMYYVGPATSLTATPRLYAEKHTVQPSGMTPAVAAVHEFLTSAPLDPDYRSGWPWGVDVTRLSTANGVTTIALRGHVNLGTVPSPVPFDPSRTVAVQGLLETAGIQGRARFTYNGHPLKLVLYTSASVKAQPRAALRPMVSIDNVVEGQTLTDPVTIKVSGNVVEGNVSWQLLDAAGKKQADGYATTSQGVWTQAKVPLGTLKAGTYTFRAFESSLQNGRPTYLDDKTFTVR